MKRKNLFISVVAILGLLFAYSCEEEEGEENKPYYGEWKSRVFPSYNPADSTYILQQMEFNFTNTDFTNKISQSTALTDMNLAHVITFGGIVEEKSAETIDVSIQTLDVIVQNLSADRAQDATSFDAIFGLALGSLLEKDFSADYEIYSDGDSMKLSLPTKLSAEPTQLRLGKQ